MRKTDLGTARFSPTVFGPAHRDSIRRWFAVLAVCASAVGVPIANVRAENLIDTMAQAYRYNPQLDAQRALLRATDEDVARANSGYRPDIRATGDVGRQNTTVRPSLGNSGGTTSPRGYAVQLVQPIFRGFQTTNAVNAAEASVRAGREQLRNVEQQVLLDAVTAYGNVVRDQAIVRLRENNLNFLGTELKATKDRFAVGEVTKTDVSQAEARRALGQSELDLAKANLKSSRAVYEQVVGGPPQNLSEPNPNSKLLPRSQEEAIGIGTRENPQVVGALYAEQGARYQVDQIRGELLPEAQLEATYTDRFDSSNQTDEVATASIVGRLNVPIYANGGETHARVRQAKHTHLARIQEIEQARAASQSQVVQAWSQLTGFRAQRESDKAQIEANRTALNGVREEEKVGQRTLIEVLNAQQELLQSQVQLETTKRNVLVATYSVIAAIGRLSVSEVGAASTVYDPEAHYEEVRRKWWGIDITHDDGRREHIDTWNTQTEHAPVK
ncbi:MAG: TolC family outer membrane protein [Hyphomicrobium sp.]